MTTHIGTGLEDDEYIWGDGYVGGGRAIVATEMQGRHKAYGKDLMRKAKAKGENV